MFRNLYYYSENNTRQIDDNNNNIPVGQVWHSVKLNKIQPHLADFNQPSLQIFGQENLFHIRHDSC